MEPYIGEIRPFAFNFAPEGWLFCEGQLLSIDDNPTLFTLIGTTFGGDGVSTFGLPDLRGRVPTHVSASAPVGETGGVETVTLGLSHLPAHTHGLAVSGAASSASPVGNHPGTSGVAAYGAATGVLASDTVSPTSGGASHNNIQPYLAVGYCISLFGIYPSP